MTIISTYKHLPFKQQAMTRLNTMINTYRLNNKKCGVIIQWSSSCYIYHFDQQHVLTSYIISNYETAVRYQLY